jgi:predicted alpha/beta-fold hydrolase
MALVHTHDYTPPVWLFNKHLETIYPALCRKVKLSQTPENVTLKTSDDDFLDLDYYRSDSDKLVIISHGLEGSSQRPYVLGMASAFIESGWDVIAWNYRGCSGKVNNSVKSYHSGFTQDLREVIKYAEMTGISSIALIGFSLGGNLTLKYLAENTISELVRVAVGISVPLDLHGSCIQISRFSNFLYSKRFLRTLLKKVRQKATSFPEVQLANIKKVTDLKTFDDYFTAPMHGFADAMDYYKSCSAISVLDKVQTPSLIINALNDPFLPNSCYPTQQLRNHNYVHLLAPSRGGHVGFCTIKGDRYYWSEKKAVEFVNSVV